MNISKEELEFKAAWWHLKWYEDRLTQGFHPPIKHISPYEVAPPLRADGKTYCDKCNLNMIPYAQLPEDVKQLDRNIVLGHDDCQKAWEKYKEEQPKPQPAKKR